MTVPEQSTDRAPARVPWRSLAGLARLAPAATVTTAVAATTAQATALLLPAVSARAVDRALSGGASVGLLAALGGLLALRSLAEAVNGAAQVGVSSRVGVALRRRLLDSLFASGVVVLRRFAPGDLVGRLTANTTGSARCVPALVGAGTALVASLCGIVALWLVDWPVGVAFLLVVAPVVLALRLMVGRATSAYDEYLVRLRDIAARLGDALAGSRTIRAAGTADREVRRVLAPLPELARAGRRTWRVQRDVVWQLEVGLTAIRVVVLGTAGVCLAAGRVSPGEVVAVSLLLSVALGFLYQADTLLHLADTRAHAGRVFEAAGPPGPPAAPAPRRPAARDLDLTGPAVPGLSLRGVSARLGGRDVLRRVDLDVPAGSVVALVGRSGAGKTTLALVAGRLVAPDAGQVLVDGAPVDPAELAGRVSSAFDRPVLLGRTVRDALTYGRPDATDHDVDDALRLAYADDFVRRLPAGLDTPLGAAPFSGGELQRLGLARALLHGGQVYVLDDATSSVDTVTEARISLALTGSLSGRTRLVVANRAGTAARADAVAWLDGAGIRAVAPHDTLWRTEPEYRAIFAADHQRSDHTDEPVGSTR